MEPEKLMRTGLFLASGPIKNKANDIRTNSDDPSYRAVADLTYDSMSLFQAYMYFIGLFGCGVILTFMTNNLVTDTAGLPSFIAAVGMTPERSHEIFSLSGGPVSFDLLFMLYTIVIYPIVASLTSLLFGGLGALLLFKSAFSAMSDSMRGTSFFVRFIIGLAMVVMACALVDLLPMAVTGVIFSIKLLWTLSNFTYGGVWFFITLLITLATLVVFIFDIINFVFSLLFGIKLYDLI